MIAGAGGRQRRTPLRRITNKELVQGDKAYLRVTCRRPGDAVGTERLDYEVTGEAGGLAQEAAEIVCFLSGRPVEARLFKLGPECSEGCWNGRAVGEPAGCETAEYWVRVGWAKDAGGWAPGGQHG